MRLLLFGATGMIGQAVLRECLLDPAVEKVRSVGRTSTGTQHEKLSETVLPDLLDYSAVESELTGYDACLFCLGVSTVGTRTADYTRITYEIPVAAAAALVRLNAAMTFVYMSAAGADSSERSRSLWARVKGKTENALFGMRFKAVYVFRPGFIQPLHGIRSRTRAYNVIYRLSAPLLPLLLRVFPRHVLTTEILGKSLIAAARLGAPKPILDPPDILALSRAEGPATG